MASQLKVDTITGVTTAGSVAVTGEGNSTTTNLQQGLAKAWGVLDGTGTVGLNDSFNCASIADNGTGDYTVTYTNAYGSANHSSTMTVGDGSIGARCNGGRTTTTVNYQCLSTSFGTQDDDDLSLTCHGDLA